MDVSFRLLDFPHISLWFETTPLPLFSHTATAPSFPYRHCPQFPHNATAPSFPQAPPCSLSAVQHKASIMVAAQCLSPTVPVPKRAVLCWTQSHVVQWRNNTHTHTAVFHSTPSFLSKSLTLGRPYSQLPMTRSANDRLLGLSLPQLWAIWTHFWFLSCQTFPLSILTAAARNENVAFCALFYQMDEFTASHC